MIIRLITAVLLKILKAITSPILPSPLLRLYRNIVIYPQFKDTLEKNKSLQNKHSGQRCFIVGNGPSLSQLDLNKLDSETTFVLNHFYHYRNPQKFIPSYYCYIAPDFPKYYPHIASYLGKNKKTNCLFSIYQKPLIDNQRLFDSQKVFYWFFSDIFRWYDSKVNIDITKPVLGGNFIAFAVIITAIYMGFKKIYLIGFDHNWKSTPDDVLEDRFYHRLPINPQKWVYYYDLHKDVFKPYKLIKTAAKNNHATIFNATPGSLLDVFPRVNYNHLF